MSEPYPLDALPGLIGAAVEEYQAFGQQPLGLVASSALSVVSLVTQGLADVERGRNLQGPISLNFMVVAQSGERKTAADRAMGKPLADWEQIRDELMAGDIAKNKAAKLAFIQPGFEVLHAIAKPMLTHHFELNVVGCARLDKGIRCREGYIDGLFAENVLACIGTLNAARRMHPTGCADMKNVKLTPCEEGIQSMEMRNAEGFSGFCSALKLVIRDGDQLNKFWLALVFQGKAKAPVFYGSSTDVENYVAQNPGAIGVVEAGYALK
jgi:hypothetical protein